MKHKVPSSYDKVSAKRKGDEKLESDDYHERGREYEQMFPGNGVLFRIAVRNGVLYSIGRRAYDIR